MENAVTFDSIKLLFFLVFELESWSKTLSEIRPINWPSSFSQNRIAPFHSVSHQPRHKNHEMFWPTLNTVNKGIMCSSCDWVRGPCIHECVFFLTVLQWPINFIKLDKSFRIFFRPASEQVQTKLLSHSSHTKTLLFGLTTFTLWTNTCEQGFNRCQVLQLRQGCLWPKSRLYTVTTGPSNPAPTQITNGYLEWEEIFKNKPIIYLDCLLYICLS